MKYRTHLVLEIVVLLCIGISCIFIFTACDSRPLDSGKAGVPDPDSTSGGNQPATQTPATTPVDQVVDPEIANLAVDLFDEETRKVMPAGMRMRIARDVYTLRNEDTAASLKMLSEVEMYYWPGFPEGAHVVIIPFRKNEGQWEVEAILSNRRVLKVLAECSTMSKEQAGTMVGDELRAALAEYTPMFETKWKSVLRARQKHPVVGTEPYGVGPSLQIGNNPDHSPTLSGLRLKILALMLVAGNLGLSEANEEVALATKMAMEQRERFYTSQEGIEGDRYAMLERAGIYNRQILLTANYGMWSNKFDNKELWENRRLTTFDAQTTPYDRHFPPDFSKGTINVWVHKPCDDQQFDQFMQDRK